jgi:hypothetical protein
MSIKKRNPALASPGLGEMDLADGSISPTSNIAKLTAQPDRPTWRDTYKVHPAADVFPMMSDQELEALGEDIRENGLQTSIVFGPEGVLLDGRNRLEAMERAGIALQSWQSRAYGSADPVAHIISANIKRRHLTKQEQADLIVAAIEASEKLDQIEPVSKGGRGKVNKTKAKAITEAKKLRISEATIKRALAKSEGKKPEPKPIAGPRLRAKPKLETRTGIDAARRYYLDRCEEPNVDLDAEQDIIIDALREIAGKRMARRVIGGAL